MCSLGEQDYGEIMISCTLSLQLKDYFPDNFDVKFMLCVLKNTKSNG